MMQRHINIGKSILNDYFDFYCEQMLDDADYIPVIKVIINGISKAMDRTQFNAKDIQTVKKTLMEYNRDLYINRWLENAKEDEDERNLNLEDEAESAKYYFDYIYEHGEHPS